MPFDPTLTSLRAIHSLAHTGSVSLTAAELGLTQSAVSRSISGLEKMIGLILIQRSVRPLQLTEEGQVVASHASDINQAIASLGERLAAFRHNNAGSVRIGSFGASASTRILPPLIKTFANLFPSILVTIHEANDADTRWNLDNDIVDLAVMADPGEEFEAITLEADQLVALVSEDNALASSTVLSQHDLAENNFIMTLGGSEPLIRNWFNQADIDPRVTHHVQQTHSILALVRANLGNAIVAGLSLPETITGVCQIPLYEATTNRLVLARKFQTPYSKAAELFWNYAVDSVL